MAGESIRVVVVDGQDLVRVGLRSLFAAEDGIELVGEAEAAGEGTRLVERQRPDVLVLDVVLRDGCGTDVARAVRDRGLDCRILVLSAQDSPEDLRAALAAGADGYLLKSSRAAAVVDAVRRMAAGETVIGEEFVPKLLENATRGRGQEVDLTVRESEVLGLVAEGCTNREIGARLEISTRTAQKHVENLFRKLEVNDRTRLVAQAFRRNLLH